MKIAVQLYTLRKELAEDFTGTLKKVSELGYDAVEFAGFYDIPKEKMKNLLQEYNLDVIGSHTPLEALEKNLDETLDYNEYIENKNIVIPWAPIHDINSLNVIVEKLININEHLTKRGFRLHYHNHDFEFVKYEEKYLFDLLFQKVKGLYAEIDTHWVQRAGINPIDYLKKYRDKTTLIHLKDLVEIENKQDFAPLGKGIMDLDGIIYQAKINNTEAVIVENDAPKNGGIEDISISIKYLKERIK